MTPEHLVLVQALRTTAETSDGPLVEHRPGALVLRYDFEGELEIEWNAVRFDRVFATRFTPDICCTELMIGAYSKVCTVEGSNWLSELRSRASSSRQHIPDSLQHFIIYFDHYGCIEVVANEVTVLGEGDADALASERRC